MYNSNLPATGFSFVAYVLVAAILALVGLSVTMGRGIRRAFVRR